MDFRPVVLVIGLLLLILGATMTIPALIDLVFDHPDWMVFAWASGVTVFAGAVMTLGGRTAKTTFNLRQAFLMTTVSWVVLTAFAALPFVFSELEMSYTDAFFEAMSGITTTGSTVISGLDEAPPGILLWRAILQWLGGIGVIIMAVTVLPMLQVGGMQMFKVEAFEAQDKVLPRAASLASAIALIYCAMTLAFALILWSLGMTGFEAAAHAMTTIATGGYSTADASLSAFTADIQAAVTIGMIMGGTPFILYLQAVTGRPLALFRDSQVRWYLGIIAFSVVVVALWLWRMGNWDIPEALHHGAFNVVSVMTGTGYATQDFNAWGPFPVAMLFLLMFVGGCAGSTSCGIKIFRFQILFAMARLQLARLLRPHGVFVVHYNKRPVDEAIAESVMGFFFVYAMSVVVLAMALGALGLDFTTAMSGAATAISNVGPGLGDVIGPTGNFASLPDAAKWLLSAGMLLGRLELFTVLVLFAPRFWRE